MMRKGVVEKEFGQINLISLFFIVFTSIIPWFQRFIFIIFIAKGEEK